MAGEGVLSMGRAFQTAGAKSVIMSLWSVAEQPSILLMEKFLKELLQGNDKITSWNNARAHIRRKALSTHSSGLHSFLLGSQNDLAGADNVATPTVICVQKG